MAPAFATSNAWAAEKHSVRLVGIPSSANRAHTLIPSRVIGSLTTTFSAIVASSRPSRSIPSASVAITSADTAPPTRPQISATNSR
ncbi:MAG: hypothetical protein H6Q02_168 [Acidobacteria bacterium]|nr:hypothetical protein [Acidobacteriota bacterium]